MNPLQKEFTTTISVRRTSWRILLGGCLDEQNTRIRHGFAARDTQGFQPNRMVRISNTGVIPVKNPWLTVNDSRKGRTLDEIIAGIRRHYGPLTTKKEKMLAVWRFFCDHLYDSRGGYAMSRDPVVTLNSTGFAGCFHLACLMQLVLTKMGFGKTRFIELGELGHSLPEAYYDGRYHMIDACLYTFFLDKTGEIAGIDDLKENPTLTENTVHHNGPAGFDQGPHPDYYREDIANDAIQIFPQTFHHGRTMSFELRPGESMVRFWGKQEGKYARAMEKTPQAHKTLEPSEGDILFNPDFKKIPCEEIFDSFRNVRFDARRRLMCPGTPGVTSELVLKTTSPYIITGATLEFSYFKHSGDARFSVDILVEYPEWTHFGLKHWKEIYHDRGGNGHIVKKIMLDEHVASCNEDMGLRFEYLLRFSMLDQSAGLNIGLHGFKLTTHIQCATYYLPALSLGNNRIEYTDDTPATDGKQVEVEFQWQECHDIKPPSPPRLLAPANGAYLSLAHPVFSWEPADDTEVKDYHIQVSEYANCKWPVSPNFERYISRTRFSGQKRWEPLSTVGLRKGSVYYWWLRSLSKSDVWSAWSKARRFTVKG